MGTRGPISKYLAMASRCRECDFASSFTCSGVILSPSFTRVQRESHPEDEGPRLITFSSTANTQQKGHCAGLSRPGTIHACPSAMVKTLADALCGCLESRWRSRQWEELICKPGVEVATRLKSHGTGVLG